MALRHHLFDMTTEQRHKTITSLCKRWYGYPVTTKLIDGTTYTGALVGHGPAGLGLVPSLVIGHPDGELRIVFIHDISTLEIEATEWEE